MSFEIELKACLDDIEPIQQRLTALGKYCRSFKKSDSYWFSADGTIQSFKPSGLRVRRDSGTDANGASHESVLVTYKSKEISGGIEVNDEREFAVSDFTIFENFLERFSFYRDIRKEKEGWAWTIPAENNGQAPILAEISHVAGLGWFLEIEIMADDNNPQTVRESRERLLGLLEKVGVSEEQIEARPYAELLRRL